jgi:hypothetical protein
LGTSRCLAVGIHSPGSRDRFERLPPAWKKLSLRAVLFYDLRVIDRAKNDHDDAGEVEGHDMRDKIVK